MKQLRNFPQTQQVALNGIPTSLLINCAEEIAPVLKIIFSHSLSSTIIPTSFKEAAIIPIFKTGDKSLPSNYRPISLTSVLSKVIEKIIRKQVLTFLSHKGYLNNTQHGFRSGRSCLSCKICLDVYDKIMHMINNKSTVDMIYLDFSKAFDKVDHGILLHKLRDLCITFRLGLWFFQFLELQAALCSEWSVQRYCPWPFTIFDYDYWHW